MCACPGAERRGTGCQLGLAGPRKGCTVTTYPSGSLVGPGLYYDLNEGQVTRLPSGGELPGTGVSLYMALPAWLAPPVLGLTAVAFRFFLPLVLLVVVSTGVVWRASTGAVRLWRWFSTSLARASSTLCACCSSCKGCYASGTCAGLPNGSSSAF